jgi:hypothetical protein
MITWGTARSGGRGGGDAREERLLVDLADGDAVGLIVQQGQLGLSPGDDCVAAERSGRLDHRLVQTFGRTDAAEAEVHGWLAGIEEGLHLGRHRRWSGRIQAPV